ncbi:hypothetical protein HMPREF9064_0224 [Aggregatibacter segnis ATCC 33393]|jgi:hypothetical protein|uniref:Uncharacterized protein n=1 Tax=Aggregatibacter segnis ATCC 33393 TaxID=888057 RepID=E6KVP2_9PAST|nr:hypothetical protein HMPREF9064_0224 [Aggregatibacter segnis ATCC 33393]
MPLSSQSQKQSLTPHEINITPFKMARLCVRMRILQKKKMTFNPSATK